MSLTITRARVKEKCGVADGSYDAAIDNLIAEMAPAIEYVIRDQHLDDPDPKVQATLVLGATEIVCGEFMAQRLREPGAYEATVTGGVETRPLWSSPVDPAGLKAQGYRRLGPFLKPDPAEVRVGLVSGSAVGKNPPSEG